MMRASSLTAFTAQFNRYVPIPIFLFGLTGNILNIVVFTGPRLIKNPCSIYFICSSITNLNVLFFGLIARFLSDGFKIDSSTTNLGYCRFRYFILHSSIVLSSWFIILAGIDRYLISSRNFHRRRLSNLKYARYAATLTTLIGLAMYSHVLILFSIEQLKSGPFCYAPIGTYQVFYDFFYLATFSFGPPIVMIIIGIGTFYNIHHMHIQVRPTTTANTNVHQLRKQDRQLLKMLLVQLVFTIVLTLPSAIQKLYSTFTVNVIKDSYQIAAENFVAQSPRIFTDINCSISFYVFLVFGTGFRDEFGQIIIKVVRFVFGENNRFCGRIPTFIETLSERQVTTRNRA